MSSHAELIQDVLSETPLIDGHNDLPYALRTTAGSSVEGLEADRPELQTDLPRLRKGMVGGQFWSVFVPSTLTGEAAIVATLEQIDVAQRLIARYPEHLQAARTADDVRSAFAGGRVASMLGAEGGHSIGDSLAALRIFARLGVGYMTLTHNDNNAWADSATDAPGVGGLNDFGREVVREMNRIGMLVDLSHTAHSTQMDAFAATSAPVIYSHSSCRAVCDHPRNANDEALAALVTNGGVLQVTFVPSFVSPAVARWSAARTEALGSGRFAWPGSDGASERDAEAEREARIKVWEGQNPRPQATVADVVAHLEHAREVAGIDHIGLGGDYDGVAPLPVGLEDVSTYPVLFDALAERGWSRSDLAKLAGQNVLRVMADAHGSATELL